MALEAQNEFDVRPGQLLAGKYRLEKEIGRGAMGTVWAAVHVSLGQRVAIKIISPEHADSDELRKRFDTEARAAAKLRSRFVVGVFDHGLTQNGLPYIVMEFLEGECLEDRINRFGVISLPEAARITRHIGRALARAHAHGIVHRDLKPANIFITKAEEDDDGGDWIAKVLDFGIAKVEDYSERSTTKTGTVLGTPLFMSPEQVRGASSVDSRADLYSLGMVIYNMLTGAYAFEGQSFGDLLVSICTDPLPTLSNRAPGLPDALDDWFYKTCARDPAARYQTAEELVRGFEYAIGDASTGRVSMVGSSTPTLRHHEHLAATFAAGSEPGTASGISSGAVSGVKTRETQPSGLTSASPSTVTVPGLPMKRRPPTAVWIAMGVAGAALVGGLVAIGGRVNDAGAPRELAVPDAPAPTKDAAQPSAVKPSEKPSAIDPPAQPETTPATKPEPDSTVTGTATGKPTGPNRPTGTKPVEKPPEPTTTKPVEKPPEPTTTKPGTPDVGF
ncbi:MAG TPA: protein kinase [Polyangiaceae bacterium]|nr:protein kinase [Polyangiaceae bacterium]